MILKIFICWFGAEVIFILIININNACLIFTSYYFWEKNFQKNIFEFTFDQFNAFLLNILLTPNVLPQKSTSIRTILQCMETNRCLGKYSSGFCCYLLQEKNLKGPLPSYPTKMCQWKCYKITEIFTYCLVHQGLFCSQHRYLSQLFTSTELAYGATFRTALKRSLLAVYVTHSVREWCQGVSASDRRRA